MHNVNADLRLHSLKLPDRNHFFDDAMEVVSGKLCSLSSGKDLVLGDLAVMTQTCTTHLIMLPEPLLEICLKYKHMHIRKG